jgi:hypothetical protein
MSRSKRKTPIRGMCGSRHHLSEKEEKRKFNRKMRRINKKLIAGAEDHDALVLKHKDEIEDAWGFSKDGKKWFGNKIDIKELRK